MNILQLGPYTPPRGGVQTNMLAIRDELIENGHKVSIISITRAEKITDESNVYHPRNPFELLRLIFSLRYDILHIHIGGSLPLRVQLLILVCAIFSRSRSIMTFHSGGYAVSDQAKTARCWTFRGFVFRRLGKIIVVNKLMIKMFEKFGVRSDNLKLIFPFVLSKPKADVQIPEMFQEFWKKHDKILITVGSLETGYDLPQQINVMESVLDKFPRIGLIIIGAGSMEKELRELITSKPYAQSILLAGDTDREVVLHLIERADLMIRTTIFDGDSISIREAQFLGTPVIATDNGMRPDGVGLIPIENIVALEKMIGEQLMKNERHPSLREDGKRNIRQVLEVYKDILSTKKGR